MSSPTEFRPRIPFASRCVRIWQSLKGTARKVKHHVEHKAAEITREHGRGSIITPLYWPFGISVTAIATCAKLAPEFTYIPADFAALFGVMIALAYVTFAVIDRKLLMSENERLTERSLAITERQLTAHEQSVITQHADSVTMPSLDAPKPEELPPRE